MDTKMTGFRCFSKIFATLALDESSISIRRFIILSVIVQPKFLKRSEMIGSNLMNKTDQVESLF